MKRVSILPPEIRKSSKSKTNVEAYLHRKSIAQGRKSRGMSIVDVDGDLDVDGLINPKPPGELNLDQVTANVKLNRLQNIFNEADQDGSPGLTLAEFKVAIRKTLNRDIKDSELELMFMKMDANCDGTIDWEEYVTYNLLEYKEKCQMIQMLREEPFPNEIKEINTRHHELILRVAFYPHINKRSTEIDLEDGKYATITKDGILSFWTLQMKHVRSFHVSAPSDRNTQPWYVDMACLYNNNMIAVASTERDITFFDMSTKKLVRRYVINGLEDCITCMDCKADLKDRKHMLLIWGDTAGNIISVNFEVQRGGVMFGAQDQKKNTVKRVSFSELIRGYVPNVKAYKLSNVHDDWVCKVQFVPELNCVLSCCQSATTSLFMGDMTKKKNPSYFKVNKGLLCFDYCPILNIIATGGMDYNIRVWNPYVASRAIILLKGHNKPIVQTVLNGEKNLVISIDKGKTVKVHDLTDQTCLQHISGRMVRIGPFQVSAVCFNRKLQQLILATNLLAMLEHRDDGDSIVEVKSHTKPVVAALYNENFNVVVSACEESVVSVWDLNTGEKIMQFINAHSRFENGVEFPIDVTAMTFDTAGRRLITGARDGSVKVWNFNIGQCLQEFQVPENNPVTSIVATMQRIYVTGWCRKVHVYVDGGGNESRKTWQTRHKEDILSMAYYSPNVIATSSYDGDIITWSRDTGHMYNRFNAFEGPVRVNENFEKMNPDNEHDDPEVECPDHPLPSTTKSTKSSFRERPTSKMKSIKFGLFGKRKEEEDETTNEDASPIKRASESCEHPLLRAFDDDAKICQSGKYRPRKRFSREEYENLCRTYEAAVDKILFLESREALNRKTATLFSAGAEGWIRAWSIHHQGGLLGQFNAAHKIGDSITAMATDEMNNYLFTGDSSGYFKIWDLANYCTGQVMSDDEEARHMENLKEKFTFLRVEDFVGNTFYEITRQAKALTSRPPPVKSRPEMTVKTPRLLNSFRAHVRPVTNIEFIDKRELIVTTSTDCSIRLWTLCGRYIGTFGDRWKKLPRVIIPDRIKRNIPKEIRRVGSAKTLRVLNGGRTPRWELAMDIVNSMGIDQLKNQFTHLQKKEIDIRTEEKLETSNILGKSYKRRVRYKLPPVLPKLIETPSTIAVYHSIPFVDLSPTDFTHSNAVLEEINRRRMLNLRNTDKSKEKPGVISQYNKVMGKPVVGFNKQGQPQRIKKIISRYRRQSPSGSPEMEEVRSTPTNSPENICPSLDSASRSSVKAKYPPTRF